MYCIRILQLGWSLDCSVFGPPHLEVFCDFASSSFNRRDILNSCGPNNVLIKLLVNGILYQLPKNPSQYLPRPRFRYDAFPLDYTPKCRNTSYLFPDSCLNAINDPLIRYSGVRVVCGR